MGADPEEAGPRLEAAIPALLGAIPEGFSTYSESLSFLVNDLPGPNCVSQGKGYSCGFQIYVDQDDVASRYAENFGVGAVFNALVPPRQFIGRVGLSF